MKRACLVVAVVAAVSCDGDKPAPPLSPTPIPTTQVLSSLRIQDALTSVGPGESARVQAIGRYSDGSEKDVTADATWTSTQTRIATVTAGVITGVSLGRVTITVRFESRSANLRLIIQPAGTFVLSGNITEAGPLTIADAVVAIVGSATQVRSNFSGFYEMFGVSGTISLRVTKQGYVEETRTLTVTQDQTLNLEIRPTIIPAWFSGDYRVTLTIPPSCAAVPDEHKTRNYTAAIEQSGARLKVRLRDAKFVVDRGNEKNTFEGKVTGDTAIFTWGNGFYYYYYYFDLTVQEIVSGSQILGIWGSMETKLAPNLTGNLDGGFVLREGSKREACYVTGAKVVMTRIS